MNRAVVIGSGFGGLAAAVRLRARGYRVTVLEALDQPGGRARVFRQDGFTFDAGPTVITAPYLLDELFALLGRDSRDYFELMPVDPFYRIMFTTAASSTTWATTSACMRRSRSSTRGTWTATAGWWSIPGASSRWATSSWRTSRSPAIGHAAGAAADAAAGQPPQRVRRGGPYIRDDRLRQAFSFEPLLVGGNPFRTTSIYLLIHWLERKWGVHFARGGTASSCTALVRLLEEHEVDVRMNAPVERITCATAGRRGRAAGVR
jgi:phytoene desaturase